MKLRVGIIGLSEDWETRHLPALRALSERFEVRAIYNEVALRAEQAARLFGCTAVDGYRALIERSDIDAILMLAPQWFGAAPIFAACAAGKAIYCSAVLDIDPEESRRMKQCVEKSGGAFMAELPRRLMPATLRLKELIATRLGRPELVYCHRRLVMEDHKLRRMQSRCWPLATRDMMELVDWCRYVIDLEPTTVFGVKHGADVAAGNIDYQMISLDFSQNGKAGAGPLAHISCGHYIPKKWHEAAWFRPPAELQVRCERGIAFIDLPAKVVWFDEAGQHTEILDSDRPVGERLLVTFHRAVTSLVRQTTGLEDAYRALGIVLAAQESFQTGQRLKLNFD